MTAAASEHTDVVIVGGRCAGAAMALLLARAGVDVLVLDQAEPTQDTLSTHALMRGALVLLEQWELLDRLAATDVPPATRTVFGYGDERVTIAMDPLFAPRRTVLDPLLATAAREAGARFRYGIRVEDVTRDEEGRVVGVVGRDHDREPFRIDAGFTVGADGRTSTIARHVGTETYVEGGPGAYMTYGYFPDLDVDGLHWLYRDHTAVGLIPTNGDRVLVSAATRPERRTGDLKGEQDHGLFTLIAEVDADLAAQLRTSGSDERVRAYPGVPGFLRTASGPGWVLVGDAGHFKDPNTAHGITDAFRDAALAAPAIVSALDGSGEAAAIGGFQAQRDELAMPIFEATEAICSFAWTYDELQAAHLDLSRAMKHEVGVLAGLST